MTTTVEKTAQERLEETGRKCDGCGTVIGRWTKQCLFVDGLAYCSTGGCADKINEAPCCDCGRPINPFLVDQFVTLPGVGVVCRACADQESGASNGFAAMVPPKHVKLTPAQHESIQRGPHIVVEVSAGWYQTIYPMRGQKKRVLTATSEVARAFAKCAEYNDKA
jgi:hypothetical protein